MNILPDLKIFLRQLPRWSIRGIFCAGPSFWWAHFGGFSQHIENAAMIAGIATYVVAFAWVTALPTYRDHVDAAGIGRGLSFAANARAALSPLMFLGPDMWLGVASLGILERGASWLDVGEIAGVNSFGWTYLTTLVQGTLVSATILLLVVVIWAMRKFWQIRLEAKGVAPGA